MILLDTSILSLAFRRRSHRSDEPPQAALLRELIVGDVPLAVPGIVLQELLSGVRGEGQFHRLQIAMAGFPVLLASEGGHRRAARISNACRKRGIACAAVDALIAAMTIENGGRLFTNDKDFHHIATCCKLRLFEPPS